MKRFSLSVLFILQLSVAVGQIIEPIHFTSEMKILNQDEAEIVFTATIDNGWHLYSTDLGEQGPTEATFNIVKMEGVEVVGKLIPKGKEVSQYDEMFGMTLKFFEKSGAFVQKIQFIADKYEIDCYVEYGACNDEMCLPPSQIHFKQTGDRSLSTLKTDETATQKDNNKDSKNQSLQTDTNVIEAKSDSNRALITEISDDNNTTFIEKPLWQSITKELSEFGNETSDMSLFYTFLAGMLGGFLALLTPCVWPIIPMTVSFFLKRNKNRRKAVEEAILYGLSIIVIYVILGLIVTAIFGASALNALSTNAIFNIFFFLLLVVFAASFLGAFELRLPSSWGNRVDEKAEKASGVASIFLMAFTLTLVSFSCTGPIIGFLLVAVSTQGNYMAPALGMFGFAFALAMPFTLFAIFPTMLKSAPKSGGWMNTVKVILGFIELAFALKFLSVADLAYGWHLLDREVFIALWIIIFALMGCYLLGWMHFSHDKLENKTNVLQFFLAIFSLAFAVYMIPGLWGAPLKAISAFAPPMNTQDFNLYENSVEAHYNDYDLGMQFAKSQGKPVMIDFTGYGCVNCRKMETAVWTDTKVASMLTHDYVLISLYVDDKTPLQEPITVKENGKNRILRTIGDKWSYLERTKVGANTQPVYVLLDNKGKPLNNIRSYDEDVNAYVDFLKKGLENYRK